MDNVIGRRFGKLIILRFSRKKGREKLYWCRCDCGTEKDVWWSNLRNGKTLSCGCGQHQNPFKTHGERRTRLYRIWTNMKTRCYNSNVPGYVDYGLRGIRICEEWRTNYVDFRDWAIQNGYNDTLTIERIDYNGNYEPGNCKWIAGEKQSANRRGNRFVTLRGETKTLKEWCSSLQLNYKTVHSRISRGMSELEAIEATDDART